MPKFYFTYAREAGHPFEGGWTEVEAPYQDIAVELFDFYHPLRSMEKEPFEYVMTEEEAIMFDIPSMEYHGAKCQERIRVVHEWPEEGEGEP